MKTNDLENPTHQTDESATRAWYDAYLDRYSRALREDVHEQCLEFRELAVATHDRGGKLVFAGNGASAAISSHAAADFTKQGKIRATNFHDPDFITMMANDYGYEHWIAKSIELLATPQDSIVLISSSGRSPNILRAAETSKRLGNALVTFTGFGPSNPLCKLGNINFNLNSKAYNIIENTHMIWIALVIDMIVGDAEYSVSG